MNNSTNNPMSEYLLKIQLIINNTEFKNKAEADKYETLEYNLEGEKYIRAMNKTDMPESYTYSDVDIYTIMNLEGYDEDTIMRCIKNPNITPINVKNKLLTIGRKRFLEEYVEKNKYYCNLSGKPFIGDNIIESDKVLTIPDAFYEIYIDDDAISRNQPIHEMPIKYQELFMNSSFYKEMKLQYPEATYLNYIGSNAIPIEISRHAHDGDILRINTSKLSSYNDIFGNITVSPQIIHKFTNVYKATRDYVYNTLRGDFSSIYANYDSFIRFLTIYLSIGNTLNELMKESNSLKFMNNITANNFFMLYGLPSVIMEGSSMIDFLKKFRMILMDKGTNIVYRVKDLVGYEYTDIYSLIMVKQQKFVNGVPMYKTIDGVKVPEQEIYFRRLGTTDDNTSYFKFREESTQYHWREIEQNDPRWWNTPEVEKMLYDMNYTLSNSKYIQLSTHLSMTDIYWQSVILLRGLLDNKNETQLTMLNLNYNINGATELSIFDAVLILTIMMNWQLKDFNGNSLSGNMYLPNGMYNGQMMCLDLLFNGLQSDGSPNELVLGSPYKLSSFDFDVRSTKKEFYESLNTFDYLNPDVFLPMLNNILDKKEINIGETLMTDVKMLYTYLENKLRDATNIHQFRQVTTVFNNLFLVDPERDWYSDISFDFDSILCNEYNLELNELYAFKTFFVPDMTDLIINYNDTEYPISLYNVLNYDVLTIEINGEKPFNDTGFVNAFNETMKRYTSIQIETSGLSDKIRNNYVYRNIIIDKVTLDIGNTPYGPKTFESLLFRRNPKLYRSLIDLKSKPDSMMLLMRAIVKALENYTNSSLSGLQFNVIGEDEYFRILKEIITYFKSYMVEFTKSELVYIFGGIFDNGGNSNMLNLYDEISHYDVQMIPKDSLSLFDVGYFKERQVMKDENVQFLHDEALFRIRTTYQNLMNKGYDVWYDDGNRITKSPSFTINDDDMVIGNIVNDSSSSAYKIIVNVNNVGQYPPNYVGNAL